MRLKLGILAAITSVTAVGCGGGGGSSIWDKLINDPNTDRNALYNQNAQVCGATAADARPGCTYHYNGTKIFKSEDPFYNSPYSTWTTISETYWTTECTSYYDPDWGWEQDCWDVPYTVYYDLSPSGVKYSQDSGRAVNNKSKTITNGFIAANKNAKKMITETAEKYNAVYGMNRQTAVNVAAQVLTAKANRGLVEEADTLAATIAAAFPTSVSRTEASAAIEAYQQRKDLSAAQDLLKKVENQDLKGMTPEQRAAFLRNEVGVSGFGF